MATTLPTTLAERLLFARNRRLMSQHELAAASGVSRVTIAVAELGQSQPYGSTLRKLAAALNVNPEWLAGVPDLPEESAPP